MDSGRGSFAVLWLASIAVSVAPLGPTEVLPVSAGEGTQTLGRMVVRLLAVGDINLGRSVGRTMLRGDSLYPWRRLGDTLRQFDIVFGNLESNLSDQKGLTEDPRCNTVFTGPPCGAASLRAAGFTVVATANNHALDFGADAFLQTHTLLHAAGVLEAGGMGKSGICQPASFEVKGIRFALFACTDLMNGTRNGRWKETVVFADSGLVYPAIRRARRDSAFVILSIHGGDEYADRPASRLMEFAKGAIDAGARLVLGHHPHVPYGILRYHGGIIAPSLGNFVFMQPSRYWTRHSIALRVDIYKDSTGYAFTALERLPLEADYQPRFLGTGRDSTLIVERTRIDDLMEHHAP